MNPLHRARRTASLLFAAALLAPAPAARPAKRQAPAPAPPPAPAQTPTRTKPAAQTGTGAAAKPAQTKADAAAKPGAARDTAAAAERGSAGALESASAGASVDDLFAADAYAVYGEMRMVGQHVGSEELRQMIEPLRVTGSLPGDSQQLLDFITAHAEQLMSARLVLGVMPVRAGLPSAVVAVELTSVEEARRLVPQLRTTLARRAEGGAVGARVRAVRGGSRARGRASPKRQAGPEVQAAAIREAAEPQPAPYQIRRAGRVVALSDVAFTFAKLRGAAGSAPLSEHPGFQAVRARLAAETLFLYFNTTLMNAATKRQVDEYQEQYRKMEEEQRREKAAAVKETLDAEAAGAPARRVKIDVTKTDPAAGALSVTAEIPLDAEGKISPEVRAEMERQLGAQQGPPEKPAPEEPARAREAQQRREFERQLGSMIFSDSAAGGSWPESIGVGASFEGDAVVVRAFLLSESDETPLRPVPFMPILHAGPQITSEAASVLPAETDILVSASLDLPQMYDYVASMFKLFDLAASAPDKPGVFDSQVGAFEREYKFRIKEDLLAALGNEIAVGLPGEFLGVRGVRPERKAEAKDSPPGAAASPAPLPSRTDAPVVVISLNDKRAMQDLLPRALEAAGIKGLGAQQLLEKRGQAELVTFSQGSVAFIGRFLVIAFDPAAMNRVVEAYNAGETLAASEEFRGPTGWQPKRQLGHLYVSNALTKGMIGDVHRDAEDAEDEQLRGHVARLDPNPGAVTLAATKEGGLMYELHVPKNLLSLWSASGVISQQLAPMRAHEAMARYELHTIHGMQAEYKKEHGRYAALEELRSTTVSLSEDDGPSRPAPYEARVEGYEIKISASGDRFEATATPTGYPKQGRRSFYIDQTGLLRAADLGGRPATATTDRAVR
jgi:hypothetical protein